VNINTDPLSGDIKARIVRLRRQGKSFVDIGDIVGIHNKRVADWFRRHGEQYAAAREEAASRPLPVVPSTDEFRGPTLAQLMGRR
jgi:transposase-like protein